MPLLPDDVVFSDRESEQQRLVNSITKLHQAMEQKIAAQKHEEVMPDSHLVRATHNQAQTDVNQQMNECLGELLKLQTFNELRLLDCVVNRYVLYYANVKKGCRKNGECIRTT